MDDSRPVGAFPHLMGETCGPYRVLRELGIGAMGTVYLAEPEGEPGRRVALKMLHPHLLRQKGFFTRFRREAEAGRQVDHQNVVRTFDCDLLMVQGQLCFFLVMEYTAGQTLRALLEELGRVPEHLLREIALQTSAGLAAIHAEDIVHRDLKPENILIAEDQRVRIMDLGVAKFEDTSVAITHEDRFAGSLAYIAPEQVRRETVGPAADLYSLGVLLYELATGANPFFAESAAGAIYAHLHHDPEPPRGVSPFLGAVILRLLAKTPAERFRSAAALHRTLTDAEESAWWQERREDPEWRTARGVEIPVRRTTRVYGRERERRALEEAWRRARSGRGGTILLEGEAGIGKTRLIDTFAQTAASDGATVLYGAYAPAGGGDALADAVRQHLGSDLDAELGWYLDEAPALVPAMRALLRQEPPPAGAAALDGAMLQSAWSHLLRGFGRDKPVVWIVEDLHYAAAEHRRAIVAMHRAALHANALLVASSRTPLPREELVELESSERFRRLRLRRLLAEEVQRLLHDAFRNRELAERLGGLIFEKSDGVPFFVTEMIRGLCDRKFLSPASDGRFVEARAIGRIEVPSAVRDLLEGRLSGVSAEERAVLDVCAVQGFEFDPAVTARVLGLEKVTVLQAVARLERRPGVVRGGERMCRFDHQLIQEVLYDALLPSLRAEYHARTGAVLAEDGGETPLVVVRHLLRGSEPERAFPLLLDALSQLGRAYRNEAKVELADLALAPGVGAVGALRVRVLLEKAAALFVLGRRQAHRDVLIEACALADRVGDDGLRLAVRLELARRAADSFEEDDGPVDEALALARRLGDTVAEARALTARGGRAALAGELVSAVADLEQAASLALDASEREVEAMALSNLAFCMLQLGRNRGARTYGQRSLHATREAGKPVAGVVATLNLAAAESRLGDTLAAEELQEQALQLAGSIGYRAGEAMAYLALGTTRSQLGSGADARRCFDRALAIARETGERALESRALAESGYNWLLLGRYDAARRCYDTAQRLQREIGDRVREPLMRLRQGELAAACGRADEAEALVATALAERREGPGDPLEGYARAVLGRVAELRADPDAARAHYEASLACRRATAERTSLADLLLTLGAFEHGQGRLEAARGHLREALALARAATLPNLAAVAQVWLALLPGGDVAAACTGFGRQETRIPHPRRLAAVFGLFEATGEASYLEEALRLLKDIRDGAPSGWREALDESVPLHARVRAAVRNRG